MNNELNLPNNAYPLDVLVALSELQDDVVEAQAAAAAKMEELTALRAQTAELFAERLMAEGADDEAVSAAKAMWAENPLLAAQAALGVDIAEAANPYGCNQYGEGWRQPHNGKQSWRPGNSENKNGDEKRKEAEKTEYRNSKAFVRDVKNAYKRGKLKSLIENTKWESVDEDEHFTYYFIRKNGDGDEGEGLVVPKKSGEPYVVTPDDLIDLDDDEDILTSRSLTELLDEADAIEAANPYGCNQHGHKSGCPEGGTVDEKQSKSDSDGREKEVSELKKKFETADQKVRDIISRLYDLKQEKEKIPNKTFSLTVDKANEVRKKQLDIDIRSLEKELNSALAERDKISEALRSNLN